MGPKKKPRIHKICPICGAHFEVPSYVEKHGRGKTCSYKCGRKLTAQKNSGQKVTSVQVVCQQCEKAFYLSPSKARNRKFCSRECAWTNSRGRKMLNAPKPVRVEVHCFRCGNPIQLEPYRLKATKRFYCSQECQFPQTIIKCDWCGKEKRIPPSAKKKHNFCDRKCMGQWTAQLIAKRPKQRVIVYCNWCGKKLEREPNQVNGRDVFYCDTQCFAKWKAENWIGENNPSWRGGLEPYYGPNWKRQARRARARDEHKCQYCGITEKELGERLHVHHITPLKTFERDFRWANALRNLVSLCPSCHKFLEWHSDQLIQFLSSWLPKNGIAPPQSLRIPLLTQYQLSLQIAETK